MPNQSVSRSDRLGALKVTGVSRENADAQKLTINPRKAAGVELKQRGSWWLNRPRQDFTAYASVMVVPNDAVKTVYRYSEQD